MKLILTTRARRFAFMASLLASGVFAMTCPLRGTSYYYDADGSGGGTALTYGNGIWSTTNPLWLNGSPGTAGGTYSGWTNTTGTTTADVAIIGSTAANGYTAATAPFTITLGENITAGGLTVSGGLTQSVTITSGSAAYTLALGNQGINDNQSTSGVTLTIDAALVNSTTGNYTSSTLFKYNSGTVILTRTNTYTGGTNIAGGTSGSNPGGTLQVGNGGTTGTLGAGTVTLQLQGSQTVASTLSFNRSDAYTVTNGIQIGSGSSTNTVGGVIQQAGSNKLTLSGNINTSGAATAANGAVLTFNIGRTSTTAVDTEATGTISGYNGITKTGSGILQLSAGNTYTGATAVNNGTLLVNGNQSSATGNVTVAGGATLGGTGTVGGVVTVGSGAILQGGAGAATGTLTLTATPVLNAGSAIGLTLGASNAHSTLALPTGFNGFQTNQNFTLTVLQAGTYDNVITGVASGITTSGWTVTNGSGYSFSFNDDGTNIDLVVTAVPEPSTWAAGMLCLAAGLVVWRRQQAAC